MSELAGPSRLDVVEEAGTILATTAALRISVARAPFALSVATAEGTPILAPPTGAVRAEAAGGGREAPARWAFQPAARYDGLTFGVDGALLGGYGGTGRLLRWYRVTEVTDWTRAGNLLRLRVATSDPIPRAGELDLAVLDDAVVRLSLEFDHTEGIAEVGLAAAAPEGEEYFGLGERFARCNHRGHEVLNWVEDAPFDPRPGHDWTYFPVPFFLSSRGYGFLLDTTRRAVFRLASERPDAWAATADGARLDAVLFYGPDPLEVVRRYTALTGRPPMPAPWHLGVWKTTLSGQESVLAEARRLREQDLGVSAVWIYDQNEPETNSGWPSAMGYPEGDYPDLPGLVRQLHQQGYKVLGYLNPQFFRWDPKSKQERAVFREGVQRRYFLRRPDGSTYVIPYLAINAGIHFAFGQAALYDPTNPEGVRWWQEMLRRLLVETGYDGWMHDFGEFTPRDAVFANGRTGEEIRNLYPTLYHRTGAEICREVKPDFCFFVRSGYTGSNQWAPAAWPGDQHTDWSWDRGLPGVIPAGLSVGICGTNTWGPDIGGFFDAWDRSRRTAASKELWIRWCQFGALTPIMRDHLGSKRWTTPDAVDLWTDEETVDTWRRYARLHNALVPHLLAYARIAHQTGAPTMRHLVLRYPGEPEALKQDHQYLLGDELLVAPVVEEGARTRRVWFPPGTWYSYWDETAWQGPGYQEVPAPLEQIPLFVRGGAALPLYARPVVTLAGLAADELLRALELRIYPLGQNGGEHQFRFHDGSGLRLRERAGELALSLEGMGNDRQISLRLRRGLTVAEASAEGEPCTPRRTPEGASLLPLPAGAREVLVRYR